MYATTADASLIAAPYQNGSSRTGMDRRVLFIAYQFPPVGGAGVQRVTKFIKYLNRSQWRTSVLTVANPSVPLYDDSLAADIPEQTIVRRAPTWEPSYAVKSVVSAGNGHANHFPGRAKGVLKGLIRRLSNMLLQPDPQVLWLPQAIREGRRLLKEVSHQAIVASGPPFSTFLVGSALSRRTGIPLVLDYRDEWDLSNAYLENKRLGLVSRFLQRRLQQRVVRSARAMVATTKASAQALERIRGIAGSSASVQWIYNGFDPEDFPAAAGFGPRPETCCRLVYVGTLWELTSIAPLVEGIEALADLRPDLVGRLELVVAGRCTGPQEQLLGRLKRLPCRVVRHAYLPHDQAVDLMASAHRLCVLLADLPGADRVVPAKLFEYMARRQPILAVAPRGELWDLLANYPAAQCVPPEDKDTLIQCLAGDIARPCQAPAPSPHIWDSRAFSRPYQAEQLAKLLNRLCRP